MPSAKTRTPQQDEYEREQAARFAKLVRDHEISTEDVRNISPFEALSYRQLQKDAAQAYKESHAPSNWSKSGANKRQRDESQEGGRGRR